MRFNRLFVLAMSILLSTAAFAQETAMADAMRDNGKIYVVVGVLGLIFLVLFIYLFSIDRKLQKLEEKTEK